MLSIFKKKLFSDISGTAEDMPPHVSAVLCLMIEIARMDGKVDDEEIEEIKNFYLDLYPEGNFSEAFQELKEWTSHKESFNPFINIEIISFGEMITDVSIVSLNGQYLENIFQGEVVNSKKIISWNPNNLSSGIYLVRLVNDKEQKIYKKITYLK